MAEHWRGRRKCWVLGLLLEVMFRSWAMVNEQLEQADSSACYQCNLLFHQNAGDYICNPVTVATQSMCIPGPDWFPGNHTYAWAWQGSQGTYTTLKCC
jgi:hypothetical protein